MKYCFLKAKRFNKKNLLKNALNAFKILTFIKMDFFNYSIINYYIFATKHLLLSKLKMPNNVTIKICETLNIMGYINHFIIMIIV